MFGRPGGVSASEMTIPPISIPWTYFFKSRDIFVSRQSFIWQCWDIHDTLQNAIFSYLREISISAFLNVNALFLHVNVLLLPPDFGAEAAMLPNKYVGLTHCLEVYQKKCGFFFSL